jgi:tetratricopeptide (TPR) repeat protein
MEFREPKVLNIKVPREEVLRQLEAQKDNASVDPDTVPENPTVRFKLHHTRVLQGIPALLVQDTMVLHIIQANKFRKPVYFAVTVSPQNMLGLDNRRNEQGFDNYLRMDGLTFRVMPYGGPREFIAYETMHENLFEKFQYRNLDNPDVYYNENIIGLLQNYRSAFVKLVSHHGSNREQDKAVEVLDKMSEVLPEKVIPMRSYQLSLTFARMYNDAGYPEKFEQKVEEVLTTYPLGPNEKIEIYYWLMTYYATNNQYDKSIEYVDKWLAINPDDMQAKQQRERLERLAQNANGRGDSLKTAEENN